MKSDMFRLPLLVALACLTASYSWGASPSRRLPADPSFWRRLETLPPTPKGNGYLPGLKSGEFVRFRFAAPKSKPPCYLVNLDNIVALRGGGASYQVELHLDSPTGPLLYKGARFTRDASFNAEDLSRLDATDLLTETHLKQGYVDVWATVRVSGDLWTTYRDSDGGQWDLYALVPNAEAFARWKEEQRRRQEMLARGVCVIPQPQRLELRPDDFHLTRGATILLSDGAAPADRATAEDLRRELERASGLPVPVVDAPKQNQVRLLLVPAGTSLAETVGFALPRDVGEQGYVVDVTAKQVTAAAHTTLGLYYAVQTLTQLLRRRGDAALLPGVRIVDWPDLKRRMAQYDIARGNTVNVEYWTRWIRELSRLKVNELMLYMEDDWHSLKYPFLGRPDTFTPAKARKLTAVARRYHVQLAPQLESLGHAAALLAHPEFSDLRLGGNQGAICPLAKRTLPVLDDLYGELCQAFPQSPLFHVGGDEVWGFAADPRCAELVKRVGEEGVYAFHLNNLAKLLAKRGRTMAFWGDEVLHHPKVADTLTRDAVVFDWHYGNQRAYPSLAFFQKHGFKRIYVCPAVHGFFDVYPQYRQAFGNISGFIRAGVAQKVEGACCTTWGMNRGGQAENYLYGLAYAAECAWSSQETDREFFDARFPTVWFGAPTRKDHAADMDRAFWFAWRGAEKAPFWQRLFEVSRLFFGPYAGLVDKLGPADCRRLLHQSEALQQLCAEALAAVQRLRKEATRNGATLDALEHAIRIHAYTARKCATMCRFAEDYRSAYGRQPRDQRKLRTILETASGELRKLSGELPTLKAGIDDAIRRRDGDPNDMRLFQKASRALAEYVKRVETARKAVAAGESPPDPAALGLGPRLLAKIGGWTTADIRATDKEHPTRLVFEVTTRLKTPGVYEVEWDYTGGQDGLDILSTGLYRSSSSAKKPTDLTPVVVDKHHGFTGAADRQNTYTLNVDRLAPGTRYFLVGVVYNQRNFDSRGVVWFRQPWEK